jgi:hypothetical protein
MSTPGTTTKQATAMKLVTAAMIAVLAMMPAAHAQQGSGAGSVNTMLAGCQRAASESDPPFTTQPSLIFEEGHCFGVVATLLALGQSLTADNKFCAPRGVTNGQAVGVAVAYIEARPARRSEQFAYLALEAFREAWPCRR